MKIKLINNSLPIFVLVAFAFITIIVSSCSDTDAVNSPLISMKGANNSESLNNSTTLSKNKYSGNVLLRNANGYDVIAVAGADGTGAYEGGKIGAKIGIFLGGAKGAILGGVIGACIGGAGSSYAMSKSIGLWDYVSADPFNPATSPYDEQPENADTIGYLHNELCNFLKINHPIDEHGNVDFQQVYNLSVNFLEAHGFDSVQIYYPYNEFLATISILNFDPNITYLDIRDILVQRYSESNYIEINYYNSMIDQIISDSTNNEFDIINNYQDSIATLPISEERKTELFNLISVTKYSDALWNENNLNNQ